MKGGNGVISIEPVLCVPKQVLEAVSASGKYYKPVARPKGFRHQRKMKACFQNAAMTAIDGKARYVEGIALFGDKYWAHHAWVTIDGEHAIDQTWTEPGVRYVGIEFSAKQIAEAWTLTDWCSSVIMAPHYARRREGRCTREEWRAFQQANQQRPVDDEDEG
jgi:hypothetical protein